MGARYKHGRRAVRPDRHRYCPICGQIMVGPICWDCLDLRLADSWIGLGILFGYSTGLAVDDCLVMAEEELESRQVHTAAGRRILSSVA